MKTYVIIGGVAGGATAAARLRRRDEEAQIILLERGEYVSFASCGLPYHISGAIENRDALLVSTPEKLRDEFNIEVRTRHEVLRIDREHKQIEVRDLAKDEVYFQPYDKLILSPGAQPFIPNIPGIGLPGVLTLRTIPDMDAIMRRIAADSAHQALIVGGGFIGLEMTEALVERGLQVALVEMLPQVMSALDPEMAAYLHGALREHGVRLGLGRALKEIRQGAESRLQAVLADGETVDTDLILLAIGVRPESELARAAGLDLGPRGHILVNDQMQTSDPDIYAVGDAIQVRNPVTGAPAAIPLAGPANRQGRIAASHITGQMATYRGTLGTSIVKLFDLAAGCTGANAVTLDRAGIAYLTTINLTTDHASYYPGATRQTVKLLYAPDDGKLLGAQAVGRNAIDRTIATLATAIQAGMSVYDLEHLELPYAPPFGSAKDAVNIAGYVAANRLRGDTDFVTWQTVDQLDPTKQGLLDVRTGPEWDAGQIPGAVHIPNAQLRTRLAELDPSKEWVVYCAVGRRAYGSERVLRQHGYRAKNLSGGYDLWRVAHAQQENWATWAPTCLPTEAATHTVPAEVVPMRNAIKATLNASGLQCPGPIMAVYKKMQDLADGDTLEAIATDPGFRRDIAAWCEQTGNTLVSLEERDGRIIATLIKGSRPELRVSATGALPHDKTMIVFSADLDHALAAFIIANGIAATGQKATLFFTFWGLNLLRRRDPKPVSKTLIERMFGWMMPRGPHAVKLSKLNMGGLGTAMMKGVMRSKNIDSLPTLMRAAQEAGVRMVACQMTMEMMGIKAEELIDGVEIGGVATMLNSADKSNMTLFV